MKPWVKIVLTLQMVAIVALAGYSYVKQNAASVFLRQLKEQEALLVRAELVAEKQAELAAQNAEEAMRQQVAAETAMRQALEACAGKK